MRKRNIVPYCALVVILLLLQTVSAYAENIQCVIPSINQDAQYRKVYETEFYQGMGNSRYDGKGVLQGVFVAQDGSFVIVSAETTTKFIELYDSSCKLVLQLILDTNGTVLAVTDSEDGNLVLYPVRDNVLIKVDKQGNYLYSEPVSNSVGFLTEIDALEPFTKEIAGKRYSFHGMKFFDRNSQLFTVETADGTVLFSYLPKDQPDHIITVGLSLGLIAIIVVKLLKWRKRHSTRGRVSTGDGSLC